MSDRAGVLFLLLVLTGCAKNLYDADTELYRRYKYWDTVPQDWIAHRGMNFLVQDDFARGRHYLYLTAHKDGVPYVQGDYIPASKELAFKRMAQTCGKDGYTIERAEKPARDGRILDRYFYQYPTMTIGVTFACNQDAAKEDGDSYDGAMKWKQAARSVETFNGQDYILYALPVKSDGLRQFKIRLTGKKDASQITQIARSLMLKACGSPAFTVVSKQKTADYAYDQGIPYVIDDDAVYSFAYHCSLQR